MRYRLVAAAAAVVTMCATPGAGAAQDPRPPAAPSAAPLPAPAAAATVDGAGVPVFANGATPWDIYLACRAPDARTVPALAKLCALRLPAISRSFTGTELGEWRDAASSLPLPSAIVAARDNAERALLNAARRLGTASVGTGEFPFERGRDTLPSTMQALLAKQAADAKHTFDADSQAVDVLGFADYSGNTPSPATQALAERRAEYVAGFLRRAGIPADRINIRVQLVRNPQGTEEVGERFRKASVGGASTALVRPPAEGGRRAFGLSPAEMAVGASNFLVERAQAELETYLLRVGVNRICATESWRALLRATCALLPQDADTVRYVPGAGALQGALRADLREMPYVVTETTLLKIVVHADSVARARSVPAGPALERAALAVALVRYLRAVADGTEPLAALARWEGATATLGGHTVTLPPRLRQVATIARFSWSARTDLSSQ
ncbi:MAG TPA: OmpA family protein, partial [Longimicrobium sp.]|nr:OmpA family protein [Longimicrobium sp.]